MKKKYQYWIEVKQVIVQTYLVRADTAKEAIDAVKLGYRVDVGSRVEKTLTSTYKVVGKDANDLKDEE